MKIRAHLTLIYAFVLDFLNLNNYWNIFNNKNTRIRTRKLEGWGFGHEIKSNRTVEDWKFVCSRRCQHLCWKFFLHPLHSVIIFASKARLVGATQLYNKLFSLLVHWKDTYSWKEALDAQKNFVERFRCTYCSVGFQSSRVLFSHPEQYLKKITFSSMPKYCDNVASSALSCTRFNKFLRIPRQ